MYKLFKGFRPIGEYKTILKAKQAPLLGDGIYNLIDGKGYRSTWTVLHGKILNKDQT